MQIRPNYFNQNPPSFKQKTINQNNKHMMHASMSIKHKYQLKSVTAMLNIKIIHIAEVKLRFHLND